jgi:hypothetical protein
VSRHGLAVLDDAEKRVFERRTDVNRDFKKSSSAIIEMKQALPQDAGDVDPLVRLAELRTAKELLDRKREDYLVSFEKERSEGILKSTTAAVKALDSADLIRQEAIKAANDAYEAAAEEINKTSREQQAAIQREYEAKRDEKIAAYTERVGPILNELGRLEEQSRNAAAIGKQREIIAKMTDENKELAILADKLTADIESLRSFRKTATAQMPVAGLELHDGEVFYSGLAFDQLNTAKRIELAVALAVHRSGELGVVCVDGCEALDADTMALLEKAVLEANMQMICTEVADSSFAITTNGAGDLWSQPVALATKEGAQA